MGWGDIKDNTNTVTYKGFRVVPCRIFTDGDAGSEKWSIAAEIKREGSISPPKIFIAKGKSALSEKKAIQSLLEYAKNIIDGLVPGVSVANL